MVQLFALINDDDDDDDDRGIKLLDQVMKVFERVIERKMRNLVSLDDMQFGFRPGSIFIVRQIQ